VGPGIHLPGGVEVPPSDIFALQSLPYFHAGPGLPDDQKPAGYPTLPQHTYPSTAGGGVLVRNLRYSGCSVIETQVDEVRWKMRESGEISPLRMAARSAEGVW
jgi:hypothetical protein